MPRFDLVIFDLDGTLVDSLGDIGDAVALTLQRFGLPPVGRATLRRHIGTGVKPLLRALFEVAGDQRSEEAIAAYDDIYAACSTAKTRPYPGVGELLAGSVEATKVVLTNKGSRFVGPILADLDLAGHFAASFGREAFAEAKPSRIPVEAIRKKFGASREKSIIIGDTPVDILAGKAAGIATCGVLYGYGTADELSRARPDAVVSRAIDLFDVI